MQSTGVMISCSAGYGDGGLGRRLAELIEQARAEGVLRRYYCTKILDCDTHFGITVPSRMTRLLCDIPPLRFLPGWRQHLTFDQFDRRVARLINCFADTFIGFADQSLHSFRRARALRIPRLELCSPTAHIQHVWQQHRLAYEQYPLERDWLSASQVHKVMQEYELADVIRVASEYTRETFVRAGIAREKLHKDTTTVSPRFRPVQQKRDDGLFRIVYIGALSVVKGVPLLIDAFGKFSSNHARLTLVGYSGTRGMRKYLERKLRQDSRISVCGGDPLPHLQQADLYVHPSYQDGFGRAPLEAMRCGVPVIVTEDTGMKELICGRTGLVIPTGNVDALVAAIERAHAGAFQSGSSCAS